MPRSKSNEFQSDDQRPEWLDGDDSAPDEVDSLIQGAEDSAQASGEDGTADVDETAAPTVIEDTSAVEALAQWSSGYDDPRAELAELELQRAQMKRAKKGQHAPGAYTAVKTRIAALKNQLGLE